MGNYQPMGNVYEGRLGSAMVNPFDGVNFGATQATSVPIPPEITAAEKELADANIEIARISGQIGSNPSKAAELPAVQERLAAAAKKLASLQEAHAKKVLQGGKSNKLLMLGLVAAATVGGFLYWRGGL